MTVHRSRYQLQIVIQGGVRLLIDVFLPAKSDDLNLRFPKLHLLLCCAVHFPRVRFTRVGLKGSESYYLLLLLLLLITCRLYTKSLT